MTTKLVVIGQGYVGLPLAIAAAENGFHVVGFDTDEQRVKQLSEGDSYVSDVASARLRATLDRGSYRPSIDAADLDGFDFAVITVPTPLSMGAPDLSFIEAAAETLGSRLRPGATVILESTSYPGTTEEVLAPQLHKGSDLEPGEDFHLAYSPERIDPGNKEWTFETTPKVIAGWDEVSLKKARSLYEQIVKEVVPAPSLRVAELAKVLENTFRHVNIALVNELATHTEGIGSDVWEALDIASTKPFGFMRFTPGPGVGGHCLPVDPLYLSWKVERTLKKPFRLVELANELNNQMPEYVVRRLTHGLDRRRQTVTGARILMLGLAYKANTGDLRESPALPIARMLVTAGASVRAVDPHVTGNPEIPGLARVELTAEELRKADAVLITTDHEVFDYEQVAALSSYVFDCRRRIAPAGHIESL